MYKPHPTHSPCRPCSSLHPSKCRTKLRFILYTSSLTPLALSAEEVPGRHNPSGKYWQDPAPPSPRPLLLNMLSSSYSSSLTMPVSALDTRPTDASATGPASFPHSLLEDSDLQPEALAPTESNFSLINTANLLHCLTSNVDSPDPDILLESPSRAVLTAMNVFPRQSSRRHSRAVGSQSRGSVASTQILRPAPEKTDDPPPVVNERSTANEVGTFEKENKAIQVKVLYHWCVTAGVLLVMQIIADALLSKYQHVPTPAQLCAILLLLYALASGVTVHFVSRARPYAVYLLGFGSVLMTGQVAWHWESHVARFKATHGIFPGQPSFWNMNICNATASGQGSADLLPRTSPYGLAFGCSGAELLETATFFIVLFQHCVQSSFLSRLGVRFTAIVSLTQWLLLACWPLMFPDLHGTWICRIMATGLWTAHLLQSSWFSQSVLKQHTQAMDDMQKTAAQSLKDQKDAQHADSVLNHILKNTMADALGCIERFCQTPVESDTSALSKACDILFRGLWWCKLRVAMLRIVAGCYETQRDAVDIQKFAEDFVRGRDLTLQCPSGAVPLDLTACNIVLDNAFTNAMRHGCPGDPQVKLTITISERGAKHSNVEASPDNIIDEGPRPVTVRFLVTNQANPSRPALQSWSSQDQVVAGLPTGSSRPTLSDGLGLQHIRMVANSCDMIAALWQEGAQVCFELRVETTTADSPAVTSNTQPLHVSCPFPPGLTILGLDDSAIARETLQFHFQNEIPSALKVAMYGKDVEEVEQFKEDALESGDILIVDENVDLPGAEQLGSTIVKELMAAGYDGFACIRSGNSEDADRELSLASGAHWHVGKEVRMRDMIGQLRAEYETFLLRNEVRRDSSGRTSPADTLPSPALKSVSGNGPSFASSSARDKVALFFAPNPASNNVQPSPAPAAGSDATPPSPASSSTVVQETPSRLRPRVDMSSATTEPKARQSRSGFFLQAPALPSRKVRSGFLTEPSLSPSSLLSDRGAASAYGLQSFEGVLPDYGA